MLSSHFLNYYNNYIETCNIITYLKKYDNGKKYRKPNFPEAISEYILFLILEKDKNNKYCRTGKSGDIIMITKDGKKFKIEVKCFSSKGPISFGPKEEWTEIYFIDAIKHPNIIIYKCDISNSDIRWGNIKVNNLETFTDQVKQKRRPRICFEKLKSQVEFSDIQKYNIIELLSQNYNVEIKSCIETKMEEFSKKKIRIADFFAGIGGIRLGFELVNKNSEKVYTCVFSNEIDEKAIVTYKENFDSFVNNTFVNNTDISKLDCKEIPDFDILLAGFPCQSFSLAGNKKGFQDKRGNLFFEIVRILKEKKPLGFLLENVKNLKSHDKGNTYKTIESELKNLGYTVYSKIINCTDFGIPQNRERIYIVGFLTDYNKNFSFPEPDDTKKEIEIVDFLEKDIPNKYYYTKKTVIYSKLLESVTEHIDTNQVYQYRRHYVRANNSGVCPTLTANMGSGGHNVPIIKDDKGIRKLTPRECFNLQSFPSSYRLPKISDSQLYKQIGNSVCVDVIKKIAEKMYEFIQQN